MIELPPQAASRALDQPCVSAAWISGSRCLCAAQTPLKCYQEFPALAPQQRHPSVCFDGAKGHAGDIPDARIAPSLHAWRTLLFPRGTGQRTFLLWHNRSLAPKGTKPPRPRRFRHTEDQRAGGAGGGGGGGLQPFTMQGGGQTRSKLRRPGRPCAQQQRQQRAGSLQAVREAGRWQCTQRRRSSGKCSRSLSAS